MIPERSFLRLFVPVSVLLLVAACTDAPTASPPDALLSAAPTSPQAAAALFDQVTPEVMALPRTVFAARDEATGQLVFGVEHAGVATGVQQVLSRLGVAASAYRIVVTEPIGFMNTTLRTAHRPVIGGVQIHFSNYLCTLGFSADHGGGRSFVTNSHCTDRQGQTTGTVYYQPTSSVDPNSIGIEADDPAYFKGGVCSRGKQCRYSDAARVRYQSGLESRADIAKTEGVNGGSLNVVGSFRVASQDDAATSFSGTFHKVGRTTGWTSGQVTDSCVTVNVLGSSIQMLCQTLVRRAGTQIVGSGDSGSPVFRITSGDDVELVGILWGGSSSGDLFVFSPLKSVQDELGALTATTDGVGDGDGGGGDGGGGGGGNCPPNSNSPNCR